MRRFVNLTIWVAITACIIFATGGLSIFVTARRYQATIAAQQADFDSQLAAQQEQFDQTYNEQRDEFNDQLKRQKKSFHRAIVESEAEAYYWAYYSTCYYLLVYFGRPSNVAGGFCLQNTADALRAEIHLRGPPPEWWAMVQQLAEPEASY